MSLTTDCTTQMVCCLLVFAILAEDHTHLSIRTSVTRIATKYFKEVICRIYERIMELKVTQTHKVAFLVVLYLMRTLRAVHDLRKLLVIAGVLARSVAEHRLSVCLIEVHGNLIRIPRLIKLHCLHERLVRSDSKNIFIYLLAVSYKLHLHSFLGLCSVHSEEILTLALRLEVHGSQSVAGLHALDVADTVVVLGKLLHLVRLVPVVVRLVVRVCTHHQLDIVT